MIQKGKEQNRNMKKKKTRQEEEEEKKERKKKKEQLQRPSLICTSHNLPNR